MAEYTRGNWEVRQLPITKEVYVACGTELIAGGLTEANARLIASAPDLYEALKEITTIEQSDVPYDKYDVLGAINIAKKALAKAEGGHNG